MRGLALLAACAGLAGCAGLISDGSRATAYLLPTRGNSASGSVSFTQSRDRLRVVADLSGLRPGHEHGFHIHEAGDCGSGDGESARGHFNPHAKPHGHYALAARHAGDLPPLSADRQGRARIDIELDLISVAQG
ncbi:MAG: superoxide dismutase family protein, partial [Betaproteobacteria bacterium]|nr:superoxide dismutase family protein [Betaproteobacteria bacterium]